MKFGRKRWTRSNENVWPWAMMKAEWRWWNKGESLSLLWMRNCFYVLNHKLDQKRLQKHMLTCSDRFKLCLVLCVNWSFVSNKFSTNNIYYFIFHFFSLPLQNIIFLMITLFLKPCFELWKIIFWDEKPDLIRAGIGHPRFWLPRKVGNKEKVWPTKAHSSQEHKWSNTPPPQPYILISFPLLTSLYFFLLPFTSHSHAFSLPPKPF